MIRHYLEERRRELVVATLLCTVSSALSIMLLAELNDIARDGLAGAGPRTVLAVSACVSANFLIASSAETTAPSCQAPRCEACSPASTMRPSIAQSAS